MWKWEKSKRVIFVEGEDENMSKQLLNLVGIN